MAKLQLRRTWLLTHRWLGLTVGLLLILSGVTGSLLVFRSEIDEQLHTCLSTALTGDSRCSVVEIIAAAQNSPIAEKGTISFVDFPRSPKSVWTVWFQTGTKSSPELTKAYFDPFDARMTGQRIHGADLMSWLYQLHVELFAGPVGETLVGLTGIVLMVSVVSGILLWWPLWKHSWRSALSIRRGVRFNYDVHKMGGALSSLLLFVIAFTGVYLTFPTWISPGVRLLLAGSTQPTSKPSSITPVPGGTPIDAQHAVDTVKKHFPEADIRRVHPPSTPQGTFIVRFRLPGDIHRSLGSSRAWIDQYSGELVQARDSRQQAAADTFLSWQLPLHNGEAFGIVGRCLVLGTGLMPLILYITGFRIWWRKSAHPLRQRARHQLLIRQGEVSERMRRGTASPEQ